jgi:hypothetical protein
MLEGTPKPKPNQGRLGVGVAFRDISLAHRFSPSTAMLTKTDVDAHL